MSWWERGLAIWGVLILVFLALWIAVHGGIKDDATIAAEAKADADEARR